MEGQNLPKTDNLSQSGSITESSMHLKKYFMRYLNFQNELVKKVKIGTTNYN